MTVVREMVRRGQGNHTCEPFERSYHVSNWCAAWKDLDFSPAVKNKENKTKPKVLVLGSSGEKKTPLRCKSISASVCIHLLMYSLGAHLVAHGRGVLGAV